MTDVYLSYGPSCRLVGWLVGRSGERERERERLKERNRQRKRGERDGQRKREIELKNMVIPEPINVYSSCLL